MDRPAAGADDELQSKPASSTVEEEEDLDALLAAELAALGSTGAAPTAECSRATSCAALPPLPSLGSSSRDDDDDDDGDNDNSAGDLPLIAALREALAQRDAFLARAAEDLGCGSSDAADVAPPLSSSQEQQGALEAVESLEVAAADPSDGAGACAPAPLAAAAVAEPAAAVADSEVDHSQQQQQPDELSAQTPRAAAAATTDDSIVARLARIDAESAARAAARDAQRAALAALQSRRAEAARSIARAWRQYRGGPSRCACIAAAVTLQASLRAAAARQRFANLRRAADALKALRQALMQGGQGAAATALVAAAREAGISAEEIEGVLAAHAAAQTAALDEARKAAVSGTFAAYESAHARASLFGELASSLLECAAAFEARQDAARAALVDAAANLPARAVAAAADAAATLGVPPAEVSAALERARTRDAAAAKAAAAAAQCFDAESFASALAACERYGLGADAAAARAAVERRQRAAASRLSRACAAAFGPPNGSLLAEAAAGGGAIAEVLDAVVQCRALGLVTEVAEAEARLSEARAVALRELDAAAGGGSAANAAAAARRATMLAADAGAVEAAAARLQARKADARGQLLAAAEHCASACEYESARAEAAKLGCAESDLAAAAAAFDAHRHATARRVIAAASVLICALRQSWRERGAALWESSIASAVAASLRTGSGLSVADVPLSEAPGQLKAMLCELQHGWDACRALGCAAAARPALKVTLARCREHERDRGSVVAAAVYAVDDDGVPAAPPWPGDKDDLDGLDDLSSSGSYSGGAAGALLAGALQPRESRQRTPQPDERSAAQEWREQHAALQALPNASLLELAAAAVTQAPSPTLAPRELHAQGTALRAPPSLNGMPHLRQLHLDANELTYLAPLPSSSPCTNASDQQRQPASPPPMVCTLTAGDNRIASIAAPLHPRPARALVEWCGGALRELRLRGNALASLAGLAGCSYLRVVDVGRNRLTGLEGLEDCRLLSVLLAPHNALATLDARLLARWPLLARLDASGNAALAAPRLPPMLRLKALELRDCGLTAPPRAAPGALPALRRLDLSFNPIRAPPAMVATAVREFAPALAALELHDSPAAAEVGYRAATGRALPWLAELDHADLLPPAEEAAASNGSGSGWPLAGRAFASLAASARAALALQRRLAAAPGVCCGGGTRAQRDATVRHWLPLILARIERQKRVCKCSSSGGDACSCGVHAGWQTEWDFSTAVGLARSHALQSAVLAALKPRSVAADDDSGAAPAAFPPLLQAWQHSDQHTLADAAPELEAAANAAAAAAAAAVAAALPPSARANALEDALYEHERCALRMAARHWAEMRQPPQTRQAALLVHAAYERRLSSLRGAAEARRKAAETLQAAWRGRACRAAVERERRARVAAGGAAAAAAAVAAAATVLQAAVRGWRVRRRLAEARQRAARDRAAAWPAVGGEELLAAAAPADEEEERWWLAVDGLGGGRTGAAAATVEQQQQRQEQQQTSSNADEEAGSGIDADGGGNGSGDGSTITAAASSTTVGTAASPAQRRQRREERLRALMAEWGFADLATAEAYLRRQDRVNRACARAAAEAKLLRDPGARLRRLRQQVGNGGGGGGVVRAAPARR